MSAPLDGMDGTALLVAIHRRWASGNFEELASIEVPEPVDEVSVLSCLYLAEALAACGREGDASELLDAVREVPVGEAVAAEVALRRGWLRREHGDNRFVDDLAEGRRLHPDHPGLWAAPDPDRPVGEPDELATEAHHATLELLSATFPNEDPLALHSRATGTLLRVLGQVIAADGEVSGFEAQLWGSPANVEEVREVTVAEAGDDPVRLLWSAVVLDRPVPRSTVQRYLEAIIALAQSTALADGEVSPEELELVDDLEAQLTAAADAGRWVAATADPGVRSPSVALPSPPLESAQFELDPAELEVWWEPLVGWFADAGADAFTVVSKGERTVQFAWTSEGPGAWLEVIVPSGESPPEWPGPDVASDHDEYELVTVRGGQVALAVLARHARSLYDALPEAHTVEVRCAGHGAERLRPASPTP